MDKHREVDEEEIDRFQEKTREIPHGWRPSAETIETIQGGPKDPPSEVKWVDRGIQDVPVDQVDLSDSPVKNTDDFRKVSYNEMIEGIHKLQEEVRPAVERGADGEYFSRLDEVRGLTHENGYRKVYDAFYGDSAIRLEKMGNNYDVVNGYHRLTVARELELNTVPARVIELIE